MRRKPDPAQRRCDITDAAIVLLAQDGVKGLSHLKVDREANLPDGTSSVYYRTRAALLHAAAERVVELDLHALRNVVDTAVEGYESAPSPLAQAILRVTTEPHLTRTKARFELSMQAGRDPELERVLRPGRLAFNQLLHAAVAHYAPANSEPNAAVRGELRDAASTYISGLLLQIVQGARDIDPLSVDSHLRALSAGLLLQQPDG